MIEILGNVGLCIYALAILGAICMVVDASIRIVKDIYGKAPFINH